METRVEVPALGESVSEAILLEWLKSDGDLVRTDEPICVLETDKANVELPAPVAGILRHDAAIDQTIKVGQSIARIDTSAEAIATVQDADTGPRIKKEEHVPHTKSQGPVLSPAVRQAVREYGVDPQAIKPSGRGDRLTRQDIVEYAVQEKQFGEKPEAESAASGDTKPAAKVPKTPPLPRPVVVSAGVPSDEEGIRRVPMTKIRRIISKRLLSVQQNTAMLTTFNEIDMNAVLDLRNRYKDKFQQVHGVKLGMTSFFARAVVLALKEYPTINAYIDNDDILYHGYIHLAIAVSTEDGLVTPVLRHVERMSFAQIEVEIQRVAKAARAGRLSIQELSGGTFTITNGGVFGSLISTPMLNPPQSAILGMHAIKKRPVVIDDRIEIRDMMYIALTYDHRLIDGRESVSFLVRIKEMLEDPGRLMLEI